MISSTRMEVKLCGWFYPPTNSQSTLINFVTLGEFVRQVAENPCAYFKYQGVLQLFPNKNSRTSDIQDQGLGFIVLIVTISPEIYKIYQHITKYNWWWIPFSVQVASPSFPHVFLFACRIHILSDWMPWFLALELTIISRPLSFLTAMCGRNVRANHFNSVPSRILGDKPSE
jgi:hypothetical protein